MCTIALCLYKCSHSEMNLLLELIIYQVIQWQFSHETDVYALQQSLGIIY